MKNKLIPHYKIEFEITEVEAISFNQSVQQAFNALNWKIVTTSETKIEGHTSLSLSSWGESITIEISDRNISIESTCVGNQLVDWGKNKKNVEALLEQLKKYDKDAFDE